MSDFTKEELESLKFHVDTSLAQDDDTEGLMIKLQFLIDNYCEHEYSPTEMLNMPLHCLKCGVKFE
jgi:hypothetical protein